MPNRFLALSPTTRVLVLAVAGALIVAAVVLGRSAVTPTFVPLFRGLELAEVGAVTDALETAGIPMRLASGGADVMVPEAQLAEAKVLLAQQGLPANGRPGLELFDKPSWGMTDFTQHITYRRALEGELARTIGMLRGVQRAQVHLGLPEASPLRRLEQGAEAAVVLVLKPNTMLLPDQVQGIAQLVASSVERLPVEKVAVLDESGRMLSRSAVTGAVGLSSDQMELQHAVERHLIDKLDPLVEAVVGPSAARIQITAALDFEQVERTVEQYDPEGQVLANEQRAEPAAGDDPATGAATQRVINNSYLSSRRVERIVGAVGAIKRLSVSVLLDEPALSGDSATIADRRTRLETLVRTAVGVDTARGDVVSVIAMPFTAPAPLTPAVADTTPVAVAPLEVAQRFAMPGVALVLGFLGFAIAWRALRTPARTGAALPVATGDEASALLASAMPEEEIIPRAAPTPASVKLRNRIAQESINSPENAARVMRAWLAEGT